MSGQELQLIPVPTGIQPGGYVAATYGDRDRRPPLTARLEAERNGSMWSIRLAWPAPEPVRTGAGETDRFVDAAALLVPEVPGAPWLSMGTPELPVAGCLWRADRDELWAIRATGLGTVERTPAPDDWRAAAAWQDGHWQVHWRLAWPALRRAGELAVAVWQGAARDRAGLKRTSAGWIAVGP